MGSNPFFDKNSFVLENGRDPKKPLYAESGEGCADSIIKWLGFEWGNIYHASDYAADDRSSNNTENI